MKLRCRVVPIVVAVVLAAGCATSGPPGADSPRATSNPQRVAAIVADPIRTAADRALDEERKPAQFLPFTGVAPGMQVLDVSTGAGYTSQLLALAVRPGGIL